MMLVLVEVVKNIKSVVYEGKDPFKEIVILYK